MIIELKIPNLGESINEVQVGEWLKAVGEFVELDEPIVEIESEKATVEMPATENGILKEQLLASGDVAKPGDVVGTIDTEGTASRKAPKKDRISSVPEEVTLEDASPSDASTPVVSAPVSDRVMPAARRVLAQGGVDASAASPTGPGARILKEDAQRAISTIPLKRVATRDERTKRMSPLRKTIATRLLEAQQNAALLTTFNEVDMSQVMALRKQVGEGFKTRHGVKLGFMSFFVKAVTQSLIDNPDVGAQMRGDEIVYFDYVDVGIAVGGGKGLVVPVLRNAEMMSFAEIEIAIADLAGRAKTGKLGMDELTGGTFTISNGGIYGSMLSTPIVNPPQSGILGLHAIEERAVVRDGQIVIRPMMYVALTYDHRIVDGREAVTFLKGVKRRIEMPASLMMEMLES